MNAQMAHPAASTIERTIKKMWKALSDISLLSLVISGAKNGIPPVQPGEEK